MSINTTPQVMESSYVANTLAQFLFFLEKKRTKKPFKKKLHQKKGEN
jgi:hypothetical protein